MEILVDKVCPSGAERSEKGVQSVKIVVMDNGNRYSAVFARTKVNSKETLRTCETFRNGCAFNEYGKIWIPQHVFAAMTKRAAAVMFGE